MAGLSGPPQTAQAESITVDGVLYENITWGKVTPASVTLIHKAGVTKIPLEKLPAQYQQRFNYDSSQAAAFRAAEDNKAVSEAKKQDQAAADARRLVELNKATASKKAQARGKSDTQKRTPPVTNEMKALDAEIKALETELEVLEAEFKIVNGPSTNRYIKGNPTPATVARQTRWQSLNKLIKLKGDQLKAKRSLRRAAR